MYFISDCGTCLNGHRTSSSPRRSPEKSGVRNRHLVVLELFEHENLQVSRRWKEGEATLSSDILRRRPRTSVEKESSASIVSVRLHHNPSRPNSHRAWLIVIAPDHIVFRSLLPLIFSNYLREIAHHGRLYNHQVEPGYPPHPRMSMTSNPSKLYPKEWF